MAILTGTIQGTSQVVQIEVQTVRIPELGSATLPYDPQNKVPIYDNGQDKTVWTLISDLVKYISDGSTAVAVKPVVYGNDVEVTVTAAQAGSNRIDIPALAGKKYSLERRGVGELLTTEWSNLSSGGWELKDVNDKIQEGEVFIAHVFDYQKTNNGSTPVTGGSGISGFMTVQSDVSLSDTSYNKLINISAGNNKITVTLPDLLAVPDYLVVPIEAMMNNNYPAKIACRAGQQIFFGNTSQDHLYLGVSEFLWLMAGDDGWYVMKASEGLLNVGQPYLDVEKRLNTEIATGQVVNRVDYPRLWEYLLSHPDMIVDESVWASNPITVGNGASVTTFYPYKSKFSKGDGATTFRFPDHSDLGQVGLYNNGGTDPDRVSNTVMTGQPDMIRSHHHQVKPPNSQGASDEGKVVSGNEATQNLTPFDTENYGGSKTVGKNYGLLPLIKI